MKRIIYPVIFLMILSMVNALTLTYSSDTLASGNSTNSSIYINVTGDANLDTCYVELGPNKYNRSLNISVWPESYGYEYDVGEGQYGPSVDTEHPRVGVYSEAGGNTTTRAVYWFVLDTINNSNFTSIYFRWAIYDDPALDYLRENGTLKITVGYNSSANNLSSVECAKNYNWCNIHTAKDNTTIINEYEPTGGQWSNHHEGWFNDDVLNVIRNETDNNILFVFNGNYTNEQRSKGSLSITTDIYDDINQYKARLMYTVYRANETMTVSGTTANFTYSQLDPDNYTFRVHCNDTSNNWDSTTERKIEILVGSPAAPPTTRELLKTNMEENITNPLLKAYLDIPSWLPIIIVAVIGGLLIILITNRDALRLDDLNVVGMLVFLCIAIGIILVVAALALREILNVL